MLAHVFNGYNGVDSLVSEEQLYRCYITQGGLVSSRQGAPFLAFRHQILSQSVAHMVHFGKTYLLNDITALCDNLRQPVCLCRLGSFTHYKQGLRHFGLHVQPGDTGEPHPIKSVDKKAAQTVQL